MKNKFIVLIYSFSHFVVDLSCAAFIYHFLVYEFGITPKVSIFILLYDFLAFVLQLPFGIFFNNRNKNSLISIVGCFLILISYALNMIPILPIILIGVGNALFHIGGGIDVLNISNKRASKIGMYVAPGALGLFIGCSINKLSYPVYLIIILLIFTIIFLGILYRKYNTDIKQDDISVFDFKFNKRIIIYLIFLTICIRGYVGFILNYSWKSSFSLSLLAIIMVVLGKAIGGLLADKFGLEKVGFFSLLISSLLFIFSFKSMIIALTSILLFNMTMPITLILLSNYLNNYGRAFGLNTFALFLGSLLYFSGLNGFNIIILPLIVFASALIFLLFCKGMKKYD